jgi:hypothetical protein
MRCDLPFTVINVDIGDLGIARTRFKPDHNRIDHLPLITHNDCGRNAEVKPIGGAGFSHYSRVKPRPPDAFDPVRVLHFDAVPVDPHCLCNGHKRLVLL